MGLFDKLNNTAQNYNRAFMGAWNNLSNSKPINAINDVFNKPQINDRPVITTEKHKNQPYSGYFSPRSGSINVVKYNSPGAQQFTRQHVLPHEMGHRDLHRASQAFRIVTPELIGSNIDARDRMRSNIYNNYPGIVSNTSQMLQRNPNLYTPDDLFDESYAELNASGANLMRRYLTNNRRRNNGTIRDIN